MHCVVFLCKKIKIKRIFARLHICHGVTCLLFIHLEWQVESWWARAVRSCAVQGCAELRGVALRALRSSARAHRSAALAAGCSGLKVKLDQLLETRGEAYFYK